MKIKARDVLIGQTFVTKKDRMIRILGPEDQEIIYDDLDGKEVIPCINLNYPEAYSWILADQEVYI